MAELNAREKNTETEIIDKILVNIKLSATYRNLY